MSERESILDGIRNGIARSNLELVQLRINAFDAESLGLARKGAPSAIVEAKKRLRNTWTDAIKQTHTNHSTFK